MADIAKVKRNVRRMVEQDAPEADIDTYLSSEGVTAEQLRNAGNAERTAGFTSEMRQRFDNRKRLISPTQRRLYQSALLGGADEFAAAGQTAFDTVGDVVSGRGPNVGRRWEENLRVQQALRDDAYDESDGVIGTLADIGGALASGAPRAVAGAARAAPGLYETAKDLAKWGAGYGAVSAPLTADGSLMERAATIPRGAAEGAAYSLALGVPIYGLARGLSTLAERRIPRARERAQRAAEMEEVAGASFGPAVSGSGTAERTATNVGSAVFGGGLRDQAGRIISGIEESTRQALRDQAAMRPSDELGQETQDFLRRQLNARSIPAEQVNAMRPEQLQDITNLPLPERYNPEPPRVPAVRPRDVERVTPEAYLDEVRRGVPQAPRPVVEPRPAQVERSTVSPDADVASALSAARQESAVLAQRLERSIEPELALATRQYQSDPFFASPLFSKWEGFIAEHKALGNEVGRRSERPIIDPARRTPEYERTLRRFEQDVGGPQRALEIMRRYDDLRFLNEARTQASARLEQLRQEVPRMETSASTSQQRNYETAVERARAEAARVADEEARAAQTLETQRLQEQAVNREAPTAIQNADRRTRELQDQARSEAAAETQRLQAAADERHAREMAERAERATGDFRLGANREHTYVTEMDAAYAMGRAHTPPVQVNPLGHRGGAPTETSRLLDSLAREARGGGLLPGYRNGQPFDETGALKGDLLDYLRPKLGNDVVQRLEYLSDRRSARGRQFSPAIQGLHDMRTAIGRAIGKDGTDSAMLRRLHEAFDTDIINFRNRGPGGQMATELRQLQDANYRELFEEIKGPLRPILGDDVKPVQALDRLARAARSGELGLLRSYMRVMIDKGDPVKAAATIVAHMADGARDMASFLKGFGEIKPEARDILFRAPAGKSYRAQLEKLERVAQHMKPYEKMARSKGGLDLSNPASLANKTNLALASAIYFQQWWLLFASVAGSAGIARFMSSPRYVRWLTELPRSVERGPKSPAALRHLAALVPIARTDTEGGEEMLSAVSEFFLPTAAFADSLHESDRMGDRLPEMPGEQLPEHEDDEQFRLDERAHRPAWRRAGRRGDQILHDRWGRTHRVQ